MTVVNRLQLLIKDQPQKTSAAIEVHRIIIQPAFRKNGTRDCVEAGPRYHSLFKNEIICTSTEPFLDSARLLKAKGYKGNIEMWHSGSHFSSMNAPLEQAAGITVSENERTPTFVKYKSFPTASKVVQATLLALSVGKALNELTAVQGIDFKKGPNQFNQIAID